MKRISFTLFMFGTSLLFIYGIQVCPYIENLNNTLRIQLAFIIYTPSLLSWLVLHKYIQKQNKLNLFTPGKLLQAGFYTWMSNGVVISLVNLILYQIPLGSGAKVMLGCFSLGNLYSVIMALLYERDQIKNAVERKISLHKEEKNFFSMTKKFSIFSSLCLIQFTFIIILLIYKDTSYLKEHVGEYIQANHQTDLFYAILGEFLFVLGILLGGSVAVFKLSSKNVAMVYDYIKQTLQNVEKGDLTREIPILSNDEFGRISLTANKMILGLREKERISNIFGKYIDPKVAEEILAGDNNLSLEGKNVIVAILFSDIRNFTTLSEHHSPKEIVQMLNIYFGSFVETIHANGGVLDKFIGDAVMAVFTSSPNSPEPCERAVSAAIIMRDNLSSINNKLKKEKLPSIQNGIGIHYGEVISGNIGSPDRLEYTVIGDTVNTAARLESASKDFKSSILISQVVYDRLPKSIQKRFKTGGSKTFKGKEKETKIFHLIA